MFFTNAPCVKFGEPLSRSHAPQQVAAMNARVALEIMRDRILRDFGQLDPETGKLVVVGLKRAQVAGKHRLAPAREQAGDAHQQLDVVALDIPGTTPHRLGIGKRRQARLRIETR